MGDTWIVSAYKFVPHYSLAVAERERDRLIAKCPKEQFRVLRVKTTLKQSNAAEIIASQNAEIERLRASWQPIETAPKDGTAFLAIVEQFSYVCIWHRHRQCWTDGGPAYMTIPADEQPTHWQPLPPPPETPE